MTDSPDQASSAPPQWLYRLLALLIFAYTASYLLWYSGTALGLAPVLDSKENLTFAWQMANGELPTEPFYRAPLYPALLGLLQMLTGDIGLTVLFGRIFNGFCHLASTALCFAIAARLWRSRWSGLFAAALFGFNPVVLWFTGDLLDIAAGITLFLGALLVALPALLPNGEKLLLRRGLLCGLLLVLAIYTRPHFLPPAIILTALLIWRCRLAAMPAFAAFGIGLLAFGSVNLLRSGEFKILPTQGPYNLWAANKPGANGKFFVQSIMIQGGKLHENPNRLESLYLYQQQTADPSPTLAESNAFWSRAFREYALDNPAALMRHLLAKAFYLLHNHEQYNNKTYSVHKGLSPTLAFNPLGFGLLVLFALCSLALANRADWPSLWPILLLAAAFAAGVALYYTSARFRLPLAPFAILVAAGLCRPETKSTIAGMLQAAPRQTALRFTAIAAACALTAALCFPWKAVVEPETRHLDYVLISQANLTLERPEAARQALAQARRIVPDYPIYSAIEADIQQIEETIEAQR